MEAYATSEHCQVRLVAINGNIQERTRGWLANGAVEQTEETGKEKGGDVAVWAAMPSMDEVIAPRCPSETTATVAK